MKCLKLTEVSAHDTRPPDRALSTKAEETVFARVKLFLFGQSRTLDGKWVRRSQEKTSEPAEPLAAERQVLPLGVSPYRVHILFEELQHDGFRWQGIEQIARRCSASLGNWHPRAMGRYLRIINIVDDGATWGWHGRRYDLIRVLDTWNERMFSVSN